MQNDDSDMKIVGDGFKPPKSKDDSELTTYLLAKERSNGNLSRARRLGAIMAEEVSAIEGGQPAEDAAILTQRRILLAFAVEVGLNKFLPNPLLSQTALSVFNETLRQIASVFYEDLQESGAFSFYYLCIREGHDVEKKVGETFASLCGRKNDEALAREGKEMYIHFIKLVHYFTDSIKFADE